MRDYFPVHASCLRFASALIAVALAVFTLAAAVSANEPEIVIPDVVVGEGAAAVTVMIRNVDSVGGINLALLVNTNYVEFVEEDAQWGTLSQSATDILNFVQVWSEDAPFQAAIFVWDGSASGDHVLFTVPLRPIEATPQPAPRFEVRRGPIGSTRLPDLRDSEIRVIIPKYTLGTYEVPGQTPLAGYKAGESSSDGNHQSVPIDASADSAARTDGETTVEHEHLIWKETNTADLPPGTPTSHSFLTVSPSQVCPNQDVAVAATLCNVSSKDFSKFVSLKVNGIEDQARSVSVLAGACEEIIFVVSRPSPGTYQIAIDNLVGQFTVLLAVPPPPSPQGDDVVAPLEQAGVSTTTILAIVSAMLILIATLVFIFRRE